MALDGLIWIILSEFKFGLQGATMSTFFNDMVIGLLQAVEIERGSIPIETVENMPANTYRVKNSEKGWTPLPFLRRDQNCFPNILHNILRM